MSDLSTNLYVMGAGVDIPAHITLQCLDALRQCRILYTVLRDPFILSLPEDVVIEVRSYWDLYQAGVPRQTNYQRAITTILDAVATEGPIAYLTPGNPVVFDSVSHGLIQQGQQSGYQVTVLPGISSIDSLLVDLRQEVAPGLQIYDASSLVQYDVSLHPEFACMLFQIDVFGSNFALHGLKVPDDFLKPLHDHLLKFYPSDHPVTFVRSKEPLSPQAHIQTMALSDLSCLDNQAQIGTSLFLPSHKTLRTKNQDFVDRMNRIESLTHQ